jgi:hypothetical protein
MASFGFDDIFSGSALSSGLGGAVVGGMASGGPIGAILGGVGGIGAGAYANYKRDEAADKSKGALDQVMKNINDYNQTAYQKRMNDLGSIMNFYGPARSAWNDMYGGGSQATPYDFSSGLGSIPSGSKF